MEVNWTPLDMVTFVTLLGVTNVTMSTGVYLTPVFYFKYHNRT